MNKSHVLENRIVRAAIDWERLHSEYQKPNSVSTKVDGADTTLALAVKDYNVFLIEEALPVKEEEEEKDTAEAK